MRIPADAGGPGSYVEPRKKGVRVFEVETRRWKDAGEARQKTYPQPGLVILLPLFQISTTRTERNERILESLLKISNFGLYLFSFSGGGGCRMSDVPLSDDFLQ